MSLINILWSIIAILLTTLFGFLINRCHNLEKDIKDIRDIKFESLRKDIESLRKDFDEKLEKKTEKLDDRTRKLEEESWRTVKDEGSTVSFPNNK